jgi:putative membrane protein
VIRTVVRIGIMLAVNALALIVASIFLHGFGINVTGFLIALVIFSASVAVLTPLLVSRLEQRSGIALIGVALAATLVSLIITDIVSDGFDISGVGGWLGTTLIVWGASALAPIVLPWFGLRRYYEKRDDRR